ncbi:glycosyltransferase family 61 protein [Flavisolibacter sp. BT320]|nr:glycosyltransferase family 61 protein [Flavisolibacter longurius]
MKVEKWKIDLPVNLISEDLPCFEKNQSWAYQLPLIVKRKLVIVYPKGYCTSCLFDPIENIAPWKEFYNSFHKNFFIGLFLKFLFRFKIRVIATATYYYCVNEFSENYFHWFTEVVPKMLSVRKIDKEAVFFLPFSLKPFQLESLKECDINFVTSDDQISIFRKVWVVENPTVYPGIYHPDLVNEVRTVFKPSCLTGNKRKIYITRRSSHRRKLLNEHAIIPILAKYSIEIFDFDLLSFDDQLAILHNTSLLVSIHGAALTNMLFLPSNSKVIEILPVAIPNDKCYFTLAGTLNVQYYYIDCEMDGNNHVTANFLVDPEEFEKQLLIATLQ